MRHALSLAIKQWIPWIKEINSNANPIRIWYLEIPCHIHSRSKLWYELWVSVRSYRHSAQINWSDIFTVYCEMQDRIYLLLFLSATLNICTVRADAFNSSRHHMTLITRAANNPSVFTIMENASTKAFSWLKAPASTFTFKTLIRHYAKRPTLMMIASWTQFHVERPWGQRPFSIVS